MLNGNAEFYTIVRKYEKTVYRQALRILGNKQDAEEVTQDVFLRIHENIEDFRQESQYETWIFRITTNTAISRRRKRKLDFVSLEEAGMDRQIRDSNRNQEEQAMDRELSKNLWRGIFRLPMSEATAISLCYFEEKSYHEIAEIMGIPQGTVGILLHRGRQHLRTKLARLQK